MEEVDPSPIRKCSSIATVGILNDDSLISPLKIWNYEDYFLIN